MPTSHERASPKPYRSPPSACSPEDNAYAHPLDMTPVVGLDSGRVLRIDLPYKCGPGGGPIEWNKENSNYHT